MSRADRKRYRRFLGLLRTPRDRVIVRDYLRRGLCPCGSEAENPGPHIAGCKYEDDGELPF